MELIDDNFRIQLVRGKGWAQQGDLRYFYDQDEQLDLGNLRALQLNEHSDGAKSPFASMLESLQSQVYGFKVFFGMERTSFARRDERLRAIKFAFGTISAVAIVLIAVSTSSGAGKIKYAANSVAAKELNRISI